MKYPKHKLNNLYVAQFKALFAKDILGTIQGKAAFYTARMLLPSIAVLIIFLITVTRNTDEFTGIPEAMQAKTLRMPRCYKLAGSNDKAGIGSKINVKNCVTLAYYPNNQLTTQIMKLVADSLELELNEQILPVNSLKELQSGVGLYGLDFGTMDDSKTLVQNLEEFQLMIYYNQSYIDSPHFYAMYNDEKFAKQLSFSFGALKMVAASSFPLILQSHVITAVMQLNDITYEPIFRQNPYISEQGKPVAPKIMITIPLSALAVLFQYLFTFIQLSQDKSSGTLDALRLSGVADFIYWGEAFVYHFGVYLISITGQLFVMYGFPFDYDMFQFIPVFEMIIVLFVGGFYATCLAMFISSICQPKVGITVSIIIFSLFLVGVLVLMMFGFGVFYDPSVMSKGISFLFQLFYPFGLALFGFVIIVAGNDVQVKVDYDTMDYSVQQVKFLSLKQFFSKIKQQDCSLKECKYDHPAPSLVIFYEFLEGLLFALLAWVLGEWIPSNSSAARPPWKLFRRRFFDISDQGFTLGTVEKKKRDKFKSKVDNKGQIRRKLTSEQARKCISEATQKCDVQVKENTKMILTSDLKGDEALIAHHIHKTFQRSGKHKQSLLQGPDHIAVKSVTMSVKQGEIYGIAGHNGAGKSTTLGVITGAVKLDKPGFKLFENDKQSKELVNNAWVDQYSIRDDMQQVRRHLGFCPQFNTNVYQDLTIYQNLEFQCRIQNIPFYEHERIIVSVLKKIGLYEWKDKQLKQLSGGMQRRISIAMSLLNAKTRLIILDEPSTGLDPQTKRVIWSVVKETARNQRKSPVIVGATIDNVRLKRIKEPLPGIIITSHDMNELNTICDSIQIMSSGQIVVQGTALELKKKFGTGYSLSVICKTNELCDQFTTEFGNYINAQHYEGFVKLVDKSGAVASYSLSNDMDLELKNAIRYIETMICTDYLVNDFCLERTSMDEVFVTVGSLYELANGGEQDIDDKAPVKQVVNTLDNSIDQISEIEFTTEDSVDIEKNGKFASIKKLSPEQIQKILSPTRSKPSTFRALLYKMSHNDQLTKAGIVSFIISPIILIVLSFLIADLLVPWFMTKLNDMISKYLKDLDVICSLCQTMRVQGLPIPECQGFDAWGYQNLCTMVKVAKLEKYQADPVWYGGDNRVWPNSTNLYQNQEESVNIFYFDNKNKKLGEYSQDEVIANLQQGVQTIESYQLNNFTLRKTFYNYLDSRGKPVNQDISIMTSQLVDEFQQNNNSILYNFPIKPIAVQQINLNNIRENNFQLKVDMRLNDGYLTYNNEQELDQNYLKYLRSQQIPYDGYKLEPTYQDEINAEIERRKTMKKGMFDDTDQRHSVFIRMDDYVNMQDIQQQVARKLPLGYISFDNTFSTSLSEELMNSQKHKVYTPMISSFLPARGIFSFYYNYQIQMIWIKSTAYKNYMNQLTQLTNKTEDQFDFIFSSVNQIQMVPSKLMSVITSFVFEMGYVTPQSGIIDINVRLANAIMRQELQKDINMRVGLQMYEYQPFSVLDAASETSQLTMTTIFVSIATFIGMIKFGNHIVLDRQSGFRRQLYLNGVRYQTYWKASIVYCLLMAILIQVIIIVFGYGIFSIKMLTKTEPLVLFLTCLGAVVGSVSLSMFLASFFAKTVMYQITTLTILVISVLVVMFSSSKIPEQAPWYTFILPSMSYVQLIMFTSYFSFTLPQLFESNYGFLLIWQFIESGILIVVALYLDKVMAQNGYKPDKWNYFLDNFKRKNKKSTFAKGRKSKKNETEGVGIEEELNFNGELICVPEQSEKLVKIDTKVQLKSKRDRAAVHTDQRMDIDVLRERRIIKEGIPADTPVIVQNLQKVFGDFPALTDVSFHVPKSSVFALLGPNGAAKTTSLHLMIGLLEQTKGKVYLHGKDMSIKHEAEEAYKNIGLCAQFDVFLPNLTVRQHLKVFAAIHGVKWNEIDDVIEKMAQFVHLGEVLDKVVSQLSGGMKRRMSLALALIG
ncbi:ABC_transporter family protein [Hexamita inflata]|uniref:ABC transporter family protein n=1 Tax=Hexamita inflata TaxID=28002 RepID=A0AA86N418_9EUKA|nr:ABC transporter family protein [Hexamita inflata]